MTTKLPVEVPHWIDGEAVAGGDSFTSTDPYRGTPVSVAFDGTEADVERAVRCARAAAPQVAAMPARERAAILRKAAALVEERADMIGETMARETGKALKDAQGEVRRSVDTISLSAEEAIRIEGSQVPLDGSETGNGKLAFMVRFPVGVVAAITPFNAPFNLACHKIAPAFAAGNATVLKPPQQCPLVIHQLVELFHDAGLPRHFLQVVHGGVETGRALVRHPGIDFVTFTGSSRAGAEIKAQSGLRRVALELGGNGPTIVCDDADVVAIAPVMARNAARLAGQSCISVQNIHVHRSLAEKLADLVAAEMRTLRLGDPLDTATDVGTLIDEAAARRVESRIEEAVAGGARILCGGRRHGAAYEPTLLANVDSQARVVCGEVFGPVASIIPFDDVRDAVDAINRGDFGLQCGLFTERTKLTLDIFRRLRTGGLIVNGTSTWRTDQLAYGGVKDSGMGREGPRYAIRDMTDERLILFNH